MVKLVLSGDLGGTNFRAALIDRAGRVRGLVSERIPQVPNPRNIVAAMASVMRRAMSGSRARPDAFALSLKGLVDPGRGLLKTVSDFVDWKDVPLVALLGKALKLPGRLENDAKSAALGEGWVGRAKGVEHYAFVIVGTGIGTGIVQGGRLQRGAHGHAGEMGHLVIDASNREFRCACGQYGHLEALAAGPSLALRAARLLKIGEPGLTRFKKTYAGPVDGLFVSEALRAKVPASRAILQEAGTWLGVGFFNIVRAVDPALIVAGGGASAIGEPLLGPARRECARRLKDFNLEPPPIQPSSLGDHAGLLGAASLYFKPGTTA